ncbi:F162A protein, partial [Acromyrmex insinuator]
MKTSIKLYTHWILRIARDKHCWCVGDIIRPDRMLSGQFIRNIQLRITRYFTRSSILGEINKVDKIPAQTSNEPTKESVIGTRMHRVTNFDKKILVWVKRYPSIADVPKDVTVDCILSARSKARIKTCNYMIVFTIIGCIGAVLLGKRDAKRGESLFKQREKWLEEIITENKKT